MSESVRELIGAVEEDNVAVVRNLVADSDLRRGINEPLGPFDSPAIVHVKSRDMLGVLLEAGADINARSKWWAGGSGCWDLAKPEVAMYAIDRGATVNAHAAARLGLLDALRQLLGGEPRLVHARGGDGQTPLHVASTVEAAELLIAAGADLDARDVDQQREICRDGRAATARRRGPSAGHRRQSACSRSAAADDVGNPVLWSIFVQAVSKRTCQLASGVRLRQLRSRSALR